MLMVLALLGAGPAAGQALYWSDTNFPAPVAGKAAPSGTVALTVPLTAETLPEGVAFDPLGGMVYWVENAFTDARILRADPNLGGITAVVGGGSALRGIAVDGASNRMYWTSSNAIAGCAIHRAGLDGSNAGVLIALGPGTNPRGIALDAASGRLYWADFDQSEIRRANVDGTAGAALASLSPGAGPWGVAYDPLHDRIYWAEYNSGAIRGVDASGANASLVLAGRPNPTHLAVDPAAGKLYWIEAAGGGPRVHRANLDGTAVEDLAIPMATFGGIAFSSLGTTPALLMWFDAEVVDGGIELRWQFQDPDRYANARIERSEVGLGGWQPIDAVPTRTPGGWIAFDREVVAGTSYRYRLVAAAGSGADEVLGEIEATAGSAITAFALSPIAPNPAVGAARIGFALPREARVRVTVLDLRGRVVAELMNGVVPAGRREISWDGQGTAGRIASGVYYVRMEAPGFRQTRTLVLTQ
jgi:sugar lactone lactonase YvrE